MQEHPVPQNITSYEFHLIGNMTVKQFLELLAGAGVAFLVYSSNLPFILKWPMILLLVFTGIALAFIPVAERPLDQWLLAFVHAIYKPTKFAWKKDAKIPDIFRDEQVSTQTVTTIASAPITGKARRSRAQDYINSISQDEVIDDPLDQEVQLRAIELQGLFQSVAPAKGVVIGHINVEEALLHASKPSLRVQTHKLSGAFVINETKQDTAVPITVNMGSSAHAMKRQYIDIPETSNTTVAFTSPVFGKQTSEEENSLSPSFVELQNAPTTTSLPRAPAVGDVQTNISLPFPTKPTVVNVVVGMVLDKNGKILDNAIVEIRSADGTPVRALKTNPLGQFSVASPLRPGNYVIEVEKDGHAFDTYSLVANNAILDPLEIRSKD